MLLLRYLLMFTGIGLLAGAAGILVWDLYQILKSRKPRETVAPGVGSTFSPELPQPAIHWQNAKRLATWGVVPFLAGLSIAMVPSGSAGVRVNQFVGTRPATLYPGVHFVLPLIETLETYSVRDEVFATRRAASTGSHESDNGSGPRCPTRVASSAVCTTEMSARSKPTVSHSAVPTMARALKAALRHRSPTRYTCHSPSILRCECSV